MAGHHTLYLIYAAMFSHFFLIIMIPPRLVAFADLELIFWKKGKEFGMDKTQGSKHRAAFLFLHSLAVAGLDLVGRWDGMGWDTGQAGCFSNTCVFVIFLGMGEKQEVLRCNMVDESWMMYW